MIKNIIPLTLLHHSESLLNNYFEWLSNTGSNFLINQDGTFDPGDIAAIEANIRELEEKYFNDAPPDQITRVPPLEWHPYIDDALINPKYLLLGTFPPPSYLLNKYNWRRRPKLQSLKIGSEPIVDFFYGNMASFWEIIGVDFDNLTKEKRISLAKSALTEKQFSVSDIILCCQRKTLVNKDKKDSRSADTNLWNIIPNLPLLNKLLDFEQLERIVFTSADWEVQRSGRLAQGSSTLSLFLDVLLVLYNSVEVQLNNGAWVSMRSVGNDNKEAFCTTYITKTRETTKEKRGLPANYAEISYSYPNFFKLRISLNGRSKEVDILGLPSPSGNAVLGRLQNILYRQWSAYKANNNDHNINADSFMSEIYNWAFSRNETDVDKLFAIQSTPLI